jgi:hypothetical protein
MTEKRRNELTEAQLDELLAGLEIESAPASLTSRLNRIPEQESRKGWRWPRFGFAPPRWLAAPAFAAVAVAVLAVFMVQDRGPSAAEVEQARKDLAIAFAYLDKAGLRTGDEIQEILGSELRKTVKQPLSEHMPFTEESLKEKTS